MEAVAVLDPVLPRLSGGEDGQLDASREEARAAWRRRRRRRRDGSGKKRREEDKHM